MSDITRADVEHLAELSRIDLTEEEIGRMTEQLGAINQLISKVQEVATPDVAPASHPFVNANVTRPDEAAPTLDRDEVLEQAPDRDETRFKVTAILGEEA
ncbi:MULTISPECIES: Asp-tRNA(Asn)/Glu-tRNA(Gln) amidotransferase subunit GatC [Gulosibacter]|uniref:Aspartyl/glutamyl-tRNA(Asn/Gln) amidotransferase subunit C n=1 Tax=Gulosibacter sediminis TaxID=1729695 RepID=A0ABY4N2H5_9MICO|nr:MULTISPECIES: Asp-tRNA(Asn)/Glu-tRNA(Gln) amidotransferase subunit GatC [Gulosibacter]UQN15433.1 Asp-tRNA(Asn)/Glu-tRNA(Gln) amidotransferase subunit GatC [Gulosibacter sediminis]